MIKKIYVRQVVAVSFFLTLTLALGFVVFEPAIIRAVEDQFTITQTITAEIAFTTAAQNVTMNGSIAGITGGNAWGTTTSVVTTNNSTGFTMTIVASSSPAMQRVGGSGTISDYTPSTAGIPDFAFAVPSGSEFGYSVSASTTADLAQKFKDDGATCNTGSADTNGNQSCWYGLSTVATSTLVTTAETPSSGATSSYYFRTLVNAGFLAAGTYNATATLTAVIN